MRFRLLYLTAAVVVLVGLATAADRRADAAFPGVNGKIAFSRIVDRYLQIFVMNPDGSSQTQLTNNAFDSDFPAGSPDGRRIAFDSCPSDCEIFVMNPDGSGKTNLTNDPQHDLAAAWSPEGKRIAFESGRSGNLDIFVMNADGSGQRNLTNNPAVDQNPTWSPDGRKIAFESDRSGVRGAREIFVMNADGSAQVNVTNTPEDFDAEPDWSPDGTKIAFASLRGGNWDIFVMNADGSGQTKLTNPSSVNFDPSWSPDGTKITFNARPLPTLDSEIFVMNADGSSQTNLTNGPASEQNPSWLSVPKPLPPPVRCVVPRVIGMRLRTARVRIRRAHCSVGRVRTAPSARARGRIISQRPRPGVRLRHGARVNLVVSRGRR